MVEFPVFISIRPLSDDLKNRCHVRDNNI